MGTTVTGTTPQDTYDSLIKVTDNGPLSGTAKYLSDGLGNDSVLALSNAGLGVGTTTPNIYATTNATNAVSIQASGANQGSILDIASTGTGFCGINMGNATIRRAFVGTIDGSEFGIYTNPTNTGAGVTERLRITSAGNVGIGTSAPASLLTIQPANDAANTLRIYRGKDGGFEAQSAIIDAQSGNVNFKLLAADSVRYFSFQLSSNSGSSYTQAARIDLDGLKFGSDTAAANALDDYEEGEWTPTFTDTLGNNVTASSVGRYTKIGRQVTLSLTTTWSNKSAASSGSLVYMSGVPFNMNNKANGIITYYDDMNLTTVGAFTIANAGTTLCYFPIQDNAVEASFLTFGETTNTSTFWFTLTYFV